MLVEYVGAVFGVWSLTFLCVRVGRCSGWLMLLCGVFYFVVVWGLEFGVSVFSRCFAAAHVFFFFGYSAYYCCINCCWWPFSSPFVMFTFGASIS